MFTPRFVIADALRALKVMAPGDMAHVDQLNAGLAAVIDLIGEIHEARGPLQDIDVPSPESEADPTQGWIANQNTRVRIQAGFTVTVTLPNSVPITPGFDPFDYGFLAWPRWNLQGSTGPADGISFRAPDDGARIEIVGTTSQLFFYCADVNDWVEATGLRLDSALPVNGRYRGPFGTLLAERLTQELTVDEPGPAFLRRVAQARELIFMRPGARAHPTRAEYF